MSEESLPQFENYEILSLIGSGGMGSVYRARDKLGKGLAVKVIHPEYGKRPEFRERFFNEARALDQLGRHSNIVFLWGLFEEGGDLYIVMDYVEGEDAGDVLKRCGPLTAESAIPIIRQSMAAIAFAHSKGVIHRDIKPSNILVPHTPNNQGPPIIKAEEDVQVMDFGIARARYIPKLTADGVIGTPEYMAPEQFEQDSEGANELSDIYALGITAYELVCGKVPFEDNSDTTAASIHQIASKKLETDPVSPTVHYPHIEPGVESIIMQAIARSPEDRFQTVQELIDALDGEARRLGIDIPGVESNQEDRNSGGFVEGGDAGEKLSVSPSQDENTGARVHGGVVAGVWFGLFLVGAVIGLMLP